VRDLADGLVCVNEGKKFVSDRGKVLNTNQIVFIFDALKLLCKLPFRTSKYLLLGVGCKSLEALCLVDLA
jgi:hypothetical protein